MSARPLSELRELARSGATGEFICVTSALEIHVYLQKGRVAWATTSSHPFEFARYIKEHHAIDEATFREVLDECRRERLPLGETLVAWELVTWDDVKAALRHQVRLALEAVAALASARTLFLERRRFTEYNAELTLELDSVVPLAPCSSVAPPRPAMSSGPDRSFARQLLESIDGAAWVEILESQRLVDAAPSAGSLPRASAELMSRTIGDEADFVAIRSARGSLIGARLASERRSLWCALAAESTFGAAVSTLWSLASFQAPAGDVPPTSLRERAAGWELGDRDCAAAAEIRVVLERARDVLAAVVISASGEPIVGHARGGIERACCLDLLRRRAEVLGVPLFADDGTEGGPRLDAMSFSFRTVVTGERDLWCFGAEVLADERQTLWVLTDRRASQGLGWACLTALGRGLARDGRPTSVKAS